MVKYFACVFIFLLAPVLCRAQDSLFKYRATSFYISVSHFILASPNYPQTNNFFPSASLSLKSASTDSVYAPLKKFNFIITTGAAASHFLFFDELYFKNFLDKKPLLVFSKRFWGGFGINYRKKISAKWIFDADIVPVVQIIVDKSIETRTDTSSWESRGFEDIYNGLLLYVNLKLEYKTQSNNAFFFTLSGSVPLLNRFVDNGDEKYRDQFKGQLFLGIGMAHFYKSKRKITAGNKTGER